MKIKVVSLLLVFCAIYSSGLSQTESFLVGRILDADTKQTIPFVTIVLQQKQFGLIANAEGDFRIKQNPVFANDYLQLTCIGYEKKIVPVKEFQTDKIHQIFLKQRVLEIDEILVVGKRKKINSLSIVRKAVQRIEENCPQKPFRSVAYYRDYQKLNRNYLNLNEAIIEHEDNGFNKNLSESRFCLLSVRANDDFKRIKFPELYYDGTEQVSGQKLIPGATLSNQGGNELAILLAHDAIRRKDNFSFSFVGNMLTDFTVNHKFEEPETVYNDTLALYKINFVSIKSKTSDSCTAKGSIYIEPENYAIHNLNYSVFYQKEEGTRQPLFNVTLEYGRVAALDTEMALKYISFNNLFKIPDEQDTSYFRVVDHQFKEADLRLDLTFNRTVDPRIAKRKRNYNISFDGIPAQIKSISVYGNQVYVTLRKGSHDYSEGSFTLENIYDSKGKLLNKKNTLEVYQYREMFVQEYNPNIVINEKCLMVGLPLMQNCVNDFEAENEYWMNSPLGDEEK